MTAQCLQAGADATLLKDGDVQALLAQLRALALQR
jgi:DNA-binding NarL/FixJ family response regulator